MHVFKHMYIYIYTYLPVNVIVRLPNPRRGDSQGHETFLAPSYDKQTRSYETQSAQTTIPPYQH